MGIPSNVSVSPEVVAVLGMSDDGSRHEPHMVCVFPDPGSNLYFLIKWFINDSLLTTTSYGAVLYPNINTTAALRPHHWSSNYSLNMNVCHCYTIYQSIIIQKASCFLIKGLYPKNKYTGLRVVVNYLING